MAPPRHQVGRGKASVFHTRSLPRLTRRRTEGSKKEWGPTNANNRFETIASTTQPECNRQLSCNCSYHLISAIFATLISNIYMYNCPSSLYHSPSCLTSLTSHVLSAEGKSSYLWKTSCLKYLPCPPQKAPMPNSQPYTKVPPYNLYVLKQEIQ